MWGLGGDFCKVAEEQGFLLVRKLRPETPYGIGPVVEHYCDHSEREFIRIPTYGQTIGEDPILES
jgi:hypothetical protein